MSYLAYYKEAVPEYSFMDDEEQYEAAIDNALEVIWERYLSELIKECPSIYIEDLRSPEVLGFYTAIPLVHNLDTNIVDRYRKPYELPQFILARVALHWTLQHAELDINMFKDMLTLLSEKHLRIGYDALNVMTSAHDNNRTPYIRLENKEELFHQLGLTKDNPTRVIEVVNNDDIPYVGKVVNLFHEVVVGSTTLTMAAETTHYDKTEEKFNLLKQFAETEESFDFVIRPNKPDKLIAFSIDNIPNVLRKIPVIHSLSALLSGSFAPWNASTLENIAVVGNDEELMAISERVTQNVAYARCNELAPRFPAELHDEDTPFLLHLPGTTQGKSLDARLSFNVPWFYKSIVLTKEEFTKDLLDQVYDLGFVNVTIQADTQPASISQAINEKQENIDV